MSNRMGRRLEQIDRNEKATLGCVIRDNAVLAELLDVVRKEDFYKSAHQAMFDAMLTLFGQNKIIDLVTLADILHSRNQIQDVPYTLLVECFEEAPNALAWRHYAQSVREQSLYRHLGYAAAEIMRNSEEQNMPAEEMLEEAERAIFALAQIGMEGSIVPLEVAVREAFQRIDERLRNNQTGVPTGYADLDKLTGGLHGGELTVLAARPSVGKTAMGIGIAGRIAIEQHRPVLFISLEQSRAELTERLLCMYGGVDSWLLRHGNLGQDTTDTLLQTRGRIQSSPLWIDDRAAQSMLRITANARRLKLKHPDLSAIIIDYLQLVEPDNRRDPRHEQVSGISRRMKLLARELKVPVVAMAQLNRAAEDHGRPRLSDLRESGGIEADADNVILLHRPQQELKNDIHLIEVLVAKQRNGPVGNLDLNYRKAVMRFENAAKKQPDPFADGD